MAQSWCVYVHEHIESGKKYIGVTSSHPPSLRWGKNGRRYENHPVFYNAIKKYGWDAFLHTVLYTDLTQEEAEAIEMNLIALYQTQDRRFGYNIREGGQFSHRSPETKAKISASLTGKHYKTPTARRGQGRAVMCVETGVTFGSIGEAARWCQTNKGTLYKVCDNPTRVAGGYHWRFIK